MQRIASALFEPPTSVPLDGAAAASKETLRRMVESFNVDITKVKNAGMGGVMGAYEQEIRAPLKGALNGRLFRAGLIQVCACVYVCCLIASDA